MGKSEYGQISFSWAPESLQMVTAAREIKRPFLLSLPGGSDVKESACSVGDPGLISGSGRSPREGNGSPLQYACLENPMDRRTWGATGHRDAKSWTRLSDLVCMHAQSYVVKSS